MTGKTKQAVEGENGAAEAAAPAANNSADLEKIHPALRFFQQNKIVILVRDGCKNSSKIWEMMRLENSYCSDNSIVFPTKYERTSRDTNCFLQRFATRKWF